MRDQISQKSTFSILQWQSKRLGENEYGIAEPLGCPLLTCGNFLAITPEGWASPCQTSRPKQRLCQTLRSDLTGAGGEQPEFKTLQWKEQP